MGIITRTVRGIVAEVLGQDFVNTLRGKGLLRTGILLHVAPQCRARRAVGHGAAAWLPDGRARSWWRRCSVGPGTGLLLNSAIFQRDIPVLQGTILVLALFFVAVNLVVDVLPDHARPKDQTRMSSTAAIDLIIPTPAQRRSRGYWGGVGRRLSRDYVTIAFGALLVLILLAILFAPLLAPHDPVSDLHAAAAQAGGLCRLPARHGRAVGAIC